MEILTVDVPLCSGLSVIQEWDRLCRGGQPGAMRALACIASTTSTDADHGELMFGTVFSYLREVRPVEARKNNAEEKFALCCVIVSDASCRRIGLGLYCSLYSVFGLTKCEAFHILCIGTLSPLLQLR